MKHEKTESAHLASTSKDKGKKRMKDKEAANGPQQKKQSKEQPAVKTTFLNGDIDETIYMTQPENFVSYDEKGMVCKLKISIYGLKQASRQWYHKFHQVVISFGFDMNVVDDCVYLKFSGRKFIFLVLYVDDILLAQTM